MLSIFYFSEVRVEMDVIFMIHTQLLIGERMCWLSFVLVIVIQLLVLRSGRDASFNRRLSYLF